MLPRHVTCRVVTETRQRRGRGRRGGAPTQPWILDAARPCGYQSTEVCPAASGPQHKAGGGRTEGKRTNAVISGQDKCCGGGGVGAGSHGGDTGQHLRRWEWYAL